jgi:hypothetical protein
MLNIGIMSENNQLLKEILKEVREIKAHIMPSSVSKNQVPNEDLTYIPELNKYVGPDYKMYSNKEKKMRKTRKNLRRLR